MSSIVEKAKKRRCYQVEIDGVQFHVRALSIADRRRLDQLSDLLQKNFFGLGRGLCEPDGAEAFPRNEGESDSDYALRIDSLLEDMPTDTFTELVSAINRLGTVPKQAVIEKNLFATATPES